MSTELICPDCGGIVGGDPADAGRACSCWSGKAATAALENGSGENSDTVIEKSDAAKTKVCCQCGTDLAGKKRLRDSRGYWCYACHKLDKEANKPKGVSCAGCSRVVAESALADFEGEMLCGICRAERKETAKERRRLSPVKTDAHDQLAKKRLYWMFGVAAVLAIIIILRLLKFIGS